jgi:MOSC domain-containing protein YiiM
LGENITTEGLDLLALPTDTILRLGDSAVIQLTGLRNPCYQINGVEPGLLSEMVSRDADGSIVRKAGVMAVVVSGGPVAPGDRILVELPLGTLTPLQPV